MKKIAAVFFAFCAFALPLGADAFAGMARDWQPSALQASSSASAAANSQSGAEPAAYDHGFSVGLSKPLKDFIDGNIAGSSLRDTCFGVSLSVDNGSAQPNIYLVQLDYYNLEKQSLLASFGYGWKFGSSFGIYAGAGVGLSSAEESIFGLLFKKKDTAWKAFVGARFTFGRAILRADISYHIDTGYTGKGSSKYRDIFGGLIAPAIFAGWLF